MTIWRIRIACWITKATVTHSEYVILIAFSLGKWLHECTLVLSHTYITCLVYFGHFGRCSTNSHGPGQLSRYSDSLRAGRYGDRIPVGARFSTPVQAGPGAHPFFYTTGTGSFPGLKRPGHGVDHPPHLTARLMK